MTTSLNDHSMTTEPARQDPRWWRSAVVYQVYPRSFADSDGDGVGDLRGIIDHLDHVRDLGVDVIWLSPIFRSPHDDNGYDISDYQDVDPSFGSLDDMDELIAEVHERGMRIVLDLVVNHTSDEHPWFVASRASRSNDKADWYLWRNPRPGLTGGTPGAEPNNWGSFFGGSAWEWAPERDQYYLHLFSAKQPDLNWDEPEVRHAVHQMMTWWLDRGVDGFRMDVINFISKAPELPDGPVLPSGYGDGMAWFSYGPHVHEYLAEMKREVFGPRDAVLMTVGEMPGVTPDQAARFTDIRDGQLNMVFQFEHVELDQGATKWDHRDATVLDLKRSLGRWQVALAEHGWNSLYWNNHDQPRVVSRWGDDRDHRYESATALATVLHLHRGTPFIYQGEELGMTNAPISTIEEVRDIESRNFYHSAVSSGTLTPDDALATLRRVGRDNARTPVPWDASPGAGFSTGSPWIPINPNHVQINAAAQRDDPHSVYHYYRRLIALRHADPTVVEGSFTMLLEDHPTVYAFIRDHGADRLLVVANLSGEPVLGVLDALAPLDRATLVLSNNPAPDAEFLAPWDARVYRR